MFGGLEEGATAFIVIFLLVIAEVGIEWHAKQALAALKLSTPRDAAVRCNGQLQTIAAEDVVPGDIVQLSVGMVLNSFVASLSVLPLSCWPSSHEHEILYGEFFT
uniref:Cation-transporting P-type ATPase N-terminal domain-containing protein n=1 Tax=Physcomitrium patens TaxID=3218 RepID=A0A2K1KHN2_PHYPA|nr:hypothetical protein PHYPA_009651 [Physcomitrium patens]